MPTAEVPWYEALQFELINGKCCAHKKAASARLISFLLNA